MPDTRERLVRAAYEVFLQKGFNAVGIDQVLKKVGVTKTTFYNHFESKDDLVAAVLLWRNKLWPKVLHKLFEERGVSDAGEKLVLVVEARDVIWELPRGTMGPFTRALCEYPSGQGPVRQALAQCSETLESELLKLAEEAAARQPLVLVRQIKLILLGVAAMHVSGKIDYCATETGVQVARCIVENHVGPKGKPPSPKKKRSKRG